MGFHTLPLGMREGSLFKGATIVSVNTAIHFIQVQVVDADRFLDDAGRDARVAYVEREQTYTLPEIVILERKGNKAADEPAGILMTPDDPRWAEQYGPRNIRADLAWDTTTGTTDSAVCVIDTGVWRDHPDIGAARWLGWRDFVSNQVNPYDDHGHGTHVAGTAAATIHNGIGIAGIAQAGIYGVKVLNSGGTGSTAAVANGVTWCVDNTIPRTVLSLSLGGPGDSTLQNAVAYAVNAGKLVVAAAGNSGPCGSCVGYPAAYADAMAVACTNAVSARCSFSSQGSQVEIAAPGHNILATVPTASCALCHSSGYLSISGTSMSTPHVSGVAALYWSHAPLTTVSDLRARLTATSQDLGDAGRDPTFGWGEVDALCLFEGNVTCSDQELPPPPPPPANDNFTGAVTIPDVPFNATQSTLDATLESGEPPSCATFGGSIDASVWYRYTPSQSGNFTVETLNSSFDTVLAAYTGSWGALTRVACNDDISSSVYQSRISVAGVGGTTYHFQIAGWNGDSGELSLSVYAGGPPPPPPPPPPPAVCGPSAPANDCFPNATIIHSTPFNATQTTSGATREAGELQPCGGMAATVWYRYTPSAAGAITADTFGSNFDTVLAVYTGSWGALTVVGCNDDASGLQSRVQWTATPGTTYHIQAGGYYGSTGSLRLNLGAAAPPPPPPPPGARPANDDFGNATLMPGFPYTQMQGTSNATMQVGEPSACPDGGSIGRSVWFQFTAGSQAQVTIDTFGSNFDTVLAVYTGAWGALAQVACNDDIFPGAQSRVALTPEVGTTYHVQVSGWNGASGLLRLNAVVEGGQPNGPPNDNFVSATQLPTTVLPSYAVSQSTVGATLESGEPTPCGAIGSTVWYSYTTLAGGLVSIDTFGSSFDTVLAVHTGTWNELVDVGCNDDTSGLQSRLQFTAMPFRTYWIQVGGFMGATGDLSLNFSMVGA